MNTSNAEIAHVAPRPLKFLADMPEVWFAQIEAQFNTAKITTDNTKYDHALQALDADVLREIYPIIINPPLEDKYLALKAAVLRIYQESEQTKIRRLLSETTFSERKPSRLLRQIQSMAGTQVTDELIKSIWLKNLPMRTQTLLAMNTAPLQQLADMADTVHELMEHDIRSSTSAERNVNATTHSSRQPRSSTSDPMQLLLEEMRQLRMELRARSPRRGEHGNRSQYSRRRSRSRSGNRGSLCYYHRRFGNRAHRCKSPCTWPNNATNNNTAAPGNANLE